MDPLSVTASVIAVLQLSASVLSYLNDVKDAPIYRITTHFVMPSIFGVDEPELELLPVGVQVPAQTEDNQAVYDERHQGGHAHLEAQVFVR